MPKPHYPPKGGPQPAGWSAAQPKPGKSSGKGGASPLEAEVTRLRQELSRTRSGGHSGGPHPGRGSLPMVWVALAACGVALLFGLMALLRHG